MKKLLLAGVACFAFAPPAFAKTDRETVPADTAPKKKVPAAEVFSTGVAKGRDRLDSATSTSALREADIAPDAALICPGNFSLKAGYDGALQLLAGPERPTALFCESDEMAIGALKRIREMGLRVPQDVSLAGFDDIELAAYCDPPLTTIAQPAEQFGQQAVEMLISLIEKRPLAARHVTLPYQLTIRQSTARVAG